MYIMAVMGMMTVTSMIASMMAIFENTFTSFFKDGFPVPDSCSDGCGVHDVELYLYMMPVTTTSMMALISMMVQMQVRAMMSMIIVRSIVHLLFNN
jgi:hypothetical protein